VLHVIDSLEPAGAELSLLAMAPHLVSAGVDLHVVHFGTGPGLGPRFEEVGVPVVRLSEPRGRAGRTRALRRHIATTRPCLVHTTLFEADVSGRVAARAAGVPVVSSLVSTPYGPAQRAASGVARWKLEGARALETVTARLVRRFQAISHTVACEMADRLRIHPDRIEVIPRGRDPEALGRRDAARRTRVRAALGLGADVPMLLTAGRHEAQKALGVAVAAFAAVREDLPGARLVMAGREGSETATVHRAIRRHGVEDAVDVLGPRSDVADLLAAADVVVFPSRWEGLGGVLIEAMALEAPVVASDLPVVREVLVDDDGSEIGWFAPVDDPAAFASACLEALSGDPRRTARARQRFLRHYTSEAVALQLVGFYDRALAS
jgi:glycosyltransferase involved in cell wall biosynthesis